MLTSSPNSSADSAREASHEDQWGLLASTVMHVALVTALSCVLAPNPATRTPPAIETHWTQAPPDDAPLVEVAQLASVTSSHQGGSAANAAIASLNKSTEPRIALDERLPQLIGPLLPTVDVHETVRLAAAPAALSGSSADNPGTGSDSGSGAAGGFFPVESNAKRIVFVVDASKSMGHHYPGPARTRLGRVKVELWRTVYQMSADQKFFIVFFNTRALPMPSAAFRSGGTEDQEDLFRWTVNIQADGDTDPYQALLLAMQLQPDVVYFLTDGEFKYTVVRDVTRANFGHVSIHTVSLGDAAGAKFLQEIADKNHGTYRHFSEDSDRYWEDAPLSTLSNAAPRRTSKPR